ncbi:hypothetical protein KIN20_030744 [Parelaphostrongylus tenuis]|uniref:Uncharacterized protein n=1 Tax=Parelaphostrongylus tenuis TaxID=148309 RepID=A0AAD5R4N3_PARTN|nr:hypothetical protein KIN20_030744 [Parelaphostrongylus tenuis]
MLRMEYSGKLVHTLLKTQSDPLCSRIPDSVHVRSVLPHKFVLRDCDNLGVMIPVWPLVEYVGYPLMSPCESERHFSLLVYGV